MNKQTVGIYVHIPFCVRKCNYCDFISYPDKREKEGEYIEALIREMQKYRGLCADTIYLGGGTPSILSKESLAKLFLALRSTFEITGGAEITIEVNPATVGREKLAFFRSVGINRLSIGVQSLDQTELLHLGRLHSPEDALNVIKWARDAGFSNLSADVIYGAAGQTKESLSHTVKTLCAQEALTHISCYALRCEEGTPFGDAFLAGTQIEAGEDECAGQYQLICGLLAQHQIERYEISNFCKSGYASRHNLKYWHCEPYIGLGAAAHSCLDDTRFFHGASLEEYLKTPEAVTLDECLDLAAQKTEFAIMALRLQEGFSAAEYEARFHSRFSEDFSAQTERFLKNGMLCFENGRYFLGEHAFFVSNAILCEFI